MAVLELKIAIYFGVFPIYKKLNRFNKTLIIVDIYDVIIEF